MIITLTCRSQLALIFIYWFYLRYIEALKNFETPTNIGTTKQLLKSHVLLDSQQNRCLATVNTHNLRAHILDHLDVNATIGGVYNSVVMGVSLGVQRN